jgi:hypothetical protein
VWRLVSGQLPFGIFGVGADFLNEKNSVLIADKNDQSVVVASNVEDYTIAGKEIRIKNPDKL